jgi:hypothetical protein
MKGSTMRTMIAAAALAVAAGTASAQTYKAEIPMTFRAAGTLMLPGAYEIRVRLGTAGTPQVVVRNADNGRQIVLLPTLGSNAPKAWQAAGKPVFAFECADGQCALRRIWTGNDLTTYRVPGSMASRPEKQAAELLVTLVKSE